MFDHGRRELSIYLRVTVLVLWEGRDSFGGRSRLFFCGSRRSVWFQSLEESLVKLACFEFRRITIPRLIEDLNPGIYASHEWFDVLCGRKVSSDEVYSVQYFDFETA